jgi:hypothetical protein
MKAISKTFSKYRLKEYSGYLDPDFEGKQRYIILCNGIDERGEHFSLTEAVCLYKELISKQHKKEVKKLRNFLSTICKGLNLDYLKKALDLKNLDVSSLDLEIIEDYIEKIAGEKKLSISDVSSLQEIITNYFLYHHLPIKDYCSN